MTRVVRAAKRVLLETTGWVMLLGGLAAIPLPGPGLLITFAGLLLLSRQYAWAERRVEMVRVRALQGAARSVATWPRLAASVVGAVVIVFAGIVWIASPPVPLWWPLAASWWLPGGVVVGVTQLASAAIAFALLGYAYRRFHAAPLALEFLERDITSTGESAHPVRSLAFDAAVRRPDYMMGGRRDVSCGCLCVTSAA